MEEVDRDVLVSTKDEGIPMAWPREQYPQFGLPIAFSFDRSGRRSLPHTRHDVPQMASHMDKNVA